MTPEKAHAATRNGATMLDFSDFNSQHTITSMKQLFMSLKQYLDEKAHGVLEWCI